MNWNRVLRPHELEHLTKLLSSGMSRHVNAAFGRTENDVGAAPVKVVNRLGDSLFVAWYRCGRDQDDVALADMDFRVFIGGDSRQCSARLTLTASDDEHALLLRQLENFVQGQEYTGRRVEVAQLNRRANVLLHRTPGHRDLFSITFSGFEHHVNATDVRGKGGDKGLPGGFANHALERIHDDSLGWGVARGLDPRSVGKERQHAFVAQSPKARLVSWLSHD